MTGWNCRGFFVSIFSVIDFSYVFIGVLHITAYLINTFGLLALISLVGLGCVLVLR